MLEAVDAADVRAPVDRALRPRSVAIVGVSSTPGSAGRNALNNLLAAGYGGEIHLVSRGGVEIEGRKSVATIDALPEGVDLAILAVPAAAMLETVQACAARGVGVGVIFASGFAELGEEGKAAQDALFRAAAAKGMSLVGPNCLGYRNYIDPMFVGFSAGMTPTIAPDDSKAVVAILTQSGGMMAHLTLALTARNLAISYAVSTGNEASLGIEDFLADFARDPKTRSVVVFAEQIRRPARFLAAVSACRELGKAVVLMHPGRSQRAQEAAQSHSGAMAGDYAAMRTLVGHAGAVIVETLEELVDVAELLARGGLPSGGGVGIVTTSGAFCSIALDYCDTLGLDVPRLSERTLAGLREILPAYAQPANPLDLTTQPQREPDLLGKGLQAVLDDPAIGSAVVAITPGGPGQAVKYFDGLQPALSRAAKPVSLAIMGDGSPLSPEFMERVRDAGIAFTRSPERALRAQAAANGLARLHDRARRAGVIAPEAPIPVPAEPGLAEHRAKALLKTLGIPIPHGALARDADEAVRIADEVGYPLALKAQATELAHKSDVGGVALSIGDEAALRAAWTRVVGAVGAARPDLTLDGLLVERMGEPGLEMILASRRDPDWGVILVVGLGGIWTETMKDVRVMPADLAAADIADELLRLKGAALLLGARGAPRRDIEAVARVGARLGAFMLANPRVAEIEINPLVVHEAGRGVVALDALAFFKGR